MCVCACVQFFIQLLSPLNDVRIVGTDDIGEIKTEDGTLKLFGVP